MDARSVWVTTKATAPGGARTEKVGLPFDPDLYHHMVEHGVFVDDAKARSPPPPPARFNPPLPAYHPPPPPPPRLRIRTMPRRPTTPEHRSWYGTQEERILHASAPQESAKLGRMLLPPM